MEIVYSGADLNAYAKVENQVGCCSPATASSSLFAVDQEECCVPASNPVATLHQDLTSLLSTYDVNGAAASVKVYSVKPQLAD